MLDDLERRPWTVVAHARTLATLQRRIAEPGAPSWLPAPDHIPPGDALLHLDLHPMNVLLGPGGPVVIDWTNAARGAAAFDAGYTYVVMATFEVEGVKDRLGQRLLVEAFAAARGRRLVRQFLAEVCDHRLADPNATPGERTAIERLRGS